MNPDIESVGSESSMHQNSETRKLTDEAVHRLKPLRYPRKAADGHGLYVLIAPTGRRYWRYNYRFDGKQKTLALGIYPDVSLAKARDRHQAARRQLADGIDPTTCKRVKKQGRRLQLVPKQ